MENTRDIENFKTLISCVNTNNEKEKIEEICADDKKLNEYMQEHFLETKHLIKFLFISFWKYKVMHTDMTYLENILTNITNKISQDTKTLTRDELVNFLSTAYKEFRKKYEKVTELDEKLDNIIPNLKENNNNKKLHIAVLGTNHIFANIQYQKLLEFLQQKNIDKKDVDIHILCKSGVNKMLTSLGSKVPEDTKSEDKEMLGVFSNKDFSSVKTHVVEGEMVGTTEILGNFFKDYDEYDNLIFLCCPNTLCRQERDVELFLSKNGKQQEDLEKITFITFEYNELINYLEKYTEETGEDISEIKGTLLKNEIILSSILSEMAKEFYAYCTKIQLTK